MFDFLPLAQPAGLSPALLAYVGDAVSKYMLFCPAQSTGKYGRNPSPGCFERKSEAHRMRNIEDAQLMKSGLSGGRNSKAAHPQKMYMMDYRYSTPSKASSVPVPEARWSASVKYWVN